MAERILAILILCVAIAAPFSLVWIMARDLCMDLSVVYPPHAAGKRCAPELGEWYDPAGYSRLLS
ncbi:hypothetical protein CDO44_10155 [Pigmentiphaga sp. NML080357]|uniref:hypothetical protein n=1 Tax=Pigmentiphaga sp. NML080357 TaxID=2008675 RepID=UPI000B416E1C|nr:hypothetical protein [Pigmentiphaga sp. NML080357]OVZ59925.1 hypothetical protein CDO44_10155 [Pigmentiphaga sp. NML080357]